MSIVTLQLNNMLKLTVSMVNSLNKLQFAGNLHINRLARWQHQLPLLETFTLSS